MYGAVRARVYASVKLFPLYADGFALDAGCHGFTCTIKQAASHCRFQNIKQIPLGVQQLCFAAFFLSFAVKVPMFPAHLVADAHVESADRRFDELLVAVH